MSGVPAFRKTWTPDDENNFQRLSKQRDEVLGRNMAAMRKVLGKIDAGLGFPRTNDMTEAMIGAMISNACELRTALKPFDDGTEVLQVEGSH